VRAGKGAVSHIRISSTEPVTFDLDIIGRDENEPHLKPTGVCGSAYVDFLSEGARTGLLGHVGKFDVEAVPGVVEHLTDSDCHSKCLQIGKGQGQTPICITAADIASLLQAKAAIAAGIVTLLDRVGLTVADIDEVYLAGGFGMHVNIESAVGCGLLPGFDPGKIRVVGNTSLAGAFMATMDRAVLDEMSMLSSRIETIELNREPMFEMNYIDHLTLPEPSSMA